MSNYAGLGELVEQIRETSRSLEQGDARIGKRLDSIEKSVGPVTAPSASQFHHPLSCQSKRSFWFSPGTPSSPATRELPLESRLYPAQRLPFATRHVQSRVW